MKNKLINKVYFLIIFVTFLFLGYGEVFASTITLVPDKENVGIEEEFYVDVQLDTGGVSVNGIEGVISFNEEELSLVRIEEGKSMVSYWIEKPRLVKSNQIKFSGIIPNGFDGLIDPFNTRQKLPGLILRLVFKGIIQAESEILSEPSIVTLNDGQGTVQNIDGGQSIIKIESVYNPQIYRITDDINPEIEYQIVQDKNLFNGRFVLIFHAYDKGTGIEKVLIKEGKRKWQEIESPYKLEDQGRRSSISIMAINFSGASIIKTIDPLPISSNGLFSQLFIIIVIVLIFIIIVIVFFYLKKIRITLIKRNVKNSQDDSKLNSDIIIED